MAGAIAPASIMTGTTFGAGADAHGVGQLGRHGAGEVPFTQAAERGKQVL